MPAARSEGFLQPEGALVSPATPPIRDLFARWSGSAREPRNPPIASRFGHRRRLQLGEAGPVNIGREDARLNITFSQGAVYLIARAPMRSWNDHIEVLKPAIRIHPLAAHLKALQGELVATRSSGADDRSRPGSSRYAPAWPHLGYRRHRDRHSPTARRFTTHSRRRTLLRGLGSRTPGSNRPVDGTIHHPTHQFTRCSRYATKRHRQGHNDLIVPKSWKKARSQRQGRGGDTERGSLRPTRTTHVLVSSMATPFRVGKSARVYAIITTSRPEAPEEDLHALLMVDELRCKPPRLHTLRSMALRWRRHGGTYDDLHRRRPSQHSMIRGDSCRRSCADRTPAS